MNRYKIALGKNLRRKFKESSFNSQEQVVEKNKKPIVHFLFMNSSDPYNLCKAPVTMGKVITGTDRFNEVTCKKCIEIREQKGII